MKVAVEYDWSPVGHVESEDGLLRFPSVADVPGLYRFDLGESIYIGEADRLKRRFQHYGTPWRSQATNLRINGLLRALVLQGARPEVSVVTSATIEVDGIQSVLELSLRVSRLLLENAALSVELLEGRRIANL